METILLLTQLFVSAAMSINDILCVQSQHLLLPKTFDKSYTCMVVTVSDINAYSLEDEGMPQGLDNTRNDQNSTWLPLAAKTDCLKV